MHSLLPLILIAITLFFLLWFFTKEGMKKRIKKDDEWGNLNEKIFSQDELPGTIIPFLRTYGAQDKYIIQSLLDSKGIPSYLSTQYVNNLLPGVRIKGHTDSILSIREQDLIPALYFVLEYMIHVQNNTEPRSSAALAYDVLSLINLLPQQSAGYLPEFLVDVPSHQAALEAFVQESQA